ncbi:hypothetical protein [Embleya sp. AB8]|uniref:hypothetical protein n=1 Tax=Embleya sp. AB8 TaxID=3156304 RepID=UPI003C723ADA
MPKTLETDLDLRSDLELAALEDEFSLGDLDLGALTVVGMYDTTALPRLDAAGSSCCSCIWHQTQ